MYSTIQDDLSHPSTIGGGTFRVFFVKGGGCRWTWSHKVMSVMEVHCCMIRDMYVGEGKAGGFNLSYIRVAGERYM